MAGSESQPDRAKSGHTPESRPSNFDDWIQPPLRDCWYLTGATCTGKTPVSLLLAQRLDAEILSLDSMAIYRGMDIGTAKPSVQQRAEVVHHLIDILPPTENFSVSNYVMQAHQEAERIRQRGKQVLVCGGTPLYLKSLLRGLFLGPAADWEFREAVESDLKRHGEQALLARLEQVDPLLAHKLHPHDHRRIIRALEVAKITGQPLSHWQQQFDTPAAWSEMRAVVLGIDRGWLHQRINWRVDNMLESGLIEETESLLSRHGRLGRTASQAVGYREVLAHIQQGVPLKETREFIKAHTRQFARRQEIWFRSLAEIETVRVEPDKSLQQVTDEIANVFSQRHF